MQKEIQKKLEQIKKENDEIVKQRKIMETVFVELQVGCLKFYKFIQTSSVLLCIKIHLRYRFICMLLYEREREREIERERERERLVNSHGYIFLKFTNLQKN